jgi:hypothetical protein
LLDQAYVVATTCDLKLEMIQIVLVRAQLQLGANPGGQGDLEAAGELVTEGLRLSTQGGYRREEALAHRLAARFSMLRHELAEAETHLRLALTIMTEIGAVLEVARTRLVLAEVSNSREGPNYNVKEAIRLIAQARESFLAVGAKWDLGQAKRMMSVREATARAHSTG